MTPSPRSSTSNGLPPGPNAPLRVKCISRCRCACSWSESSPTVSATVIRAMLAPLPGRRNGRNVAFRRVDVRRIVISAISSKLVRFKERCRTAPVSRPSTRSRPSSSARSGTRRASGCCSCCATASRRVGALQAALDLDSGGTSQHLAALRQQGLVDEPPRGHERLLPRSRTRASSSCSSWPRRSSPPGSKTPARCWTTSPSRTSARADRVSAAARARRRRCSPLGGVADARCRGACAPGSRCRPPACALLGAAGAARAVRRQRRRGRASATASSPALGIDPLSGLLPRRCWR